MDESPDEFKELQTLLRLKKYEQPPAGYAERFLKEFHRRQRWESARKTGFAAVMEAFNEWVSALTVPRYAYATTFGVFLMAALAINSFTGKPAGQSAIAGVQPVAVQTAPASLALNRPLDLSDLDVQGQMTPGQAIPTGDSRPRYVLDARPASYEAPFSF